MYKLDVCLSVGNCDQWHHKHDVQLDIIHLIVVQIRTFSLNTHWVWISIWPEKPEKGPLHMQEQQRNTRRTYFGSLSSSSAAHPSNITNQHWSLIFVASFFNLKQKELKVGCSQGLITDLQEENFFTNLLTHMASVTTMVSQTSCPKLLMLA